MKDDVDQTEMSYGRFEVSFLPDQSDESLLNELRRVASECGRHFLSGKVFEQYSGRISIATVRRRFGSWQAALARAGLRYGGPKLTEKLKTQPGRRLSGDDVIAEIKRVEALIARDVLTTSDFTAHASISLKVVRNRFGTWRNALKQAGTAQSNVAKKGWTNDECLANIALVWTYYGRQPLFREMSSPPSAMSGHLYKRRWGTWRNALRALVIAANARNADGNRISPCVSSADFDQHVAKSAIPRLDQEKGYVLPRLRFVVFQRDRFRCVICGRSPATHPNVVLHADHVTPLALGGNTTLENLQTLCSECNRGKGRFSQ
jgi:5-methylcytosine-specific restriction endonuclease McrA